MEHNLFLLEDTKAFQEELWLQVDQHCENRGVNCHIFLIPINLSLYSFYIPSQLNYQFTVKEQRHHL